MAAGVSKSERVLNLLAYLLETSHPLSRAELTQTIEGYPEPGPSQRRAFERDKELLRSLGVPVRSEPLADGVEFGYRVLPSEYYLSDPGLGPDETAALMVAVGAVALGNAAGTGALLKIGGLAAAADAPIAALPMMPVLEPLFAAVRQRAVVSFDYRTGRKTVEPWALTSERGRWYLVGIDRAHGQRRTFRTDRITGEVEVGAPRAFEVPVDADREARVATAPFDDGGELVSVRIALDAPAVAGAATRLGDDAEITVHRDGSAEVEFEASNLDAVRTFVLEFAEHAEVLAPPELRRAVVAWLRDVIERSS